MAAAGLHSAGLTLHRTLHVGEVVAPGSVRAYRTLAEGPGEPILVRDELMPVRGTVPEGVGRRSIAFLGHLTDLQLADVQSPARFEFFNRMLDEPAFAPLVPMQRPQEALARHAVDTLIRTLNAVPGSPVCEAPLQLVVTTGDAIDNAQWNELQTFLALLRGGRVAGNSASGYAGVQAVDWPDPFFWKPDGIGASGPDVFRTRYGFPDAPGLLQAALADFEAVGLSVPWLGCYGNHEALIQGVGLPTQVVRQALVGDRKPIGVLDGVDPEVAYQLMLERAEAFLTGPAWHVPSDPHRRAITRAEFVAAHWDAGGQPDGHGFTATNVAEGTAYYAYDALPDVRMIALDTNCLAGGPDGCLDREQLRWLEARLAEVHSTYLAADGTEVRTENDDRLVVLFSHHGWDTLSNDRWLRVHQALAGRPDELVPREEFRDLLHRYPNVVLWLNGHTHVNAVRSRSDPRRRTAGFWEVTTCAVSDWPSQARLVELVDNADGTLSVVCTMLDHGAPARPDPTDPYWLASFHRELAANVPWAGWPPRGPGDLLDRNVDLLLPAPFPLRTARGSTSGRP